MGVFNDIIKSEQNPYHKEWQGSGSSTLPFKETLDQNINLSQNPLDIHKKFDYLKRRPYRYFLEHRNDIIKNTGYDYRGNILKNTLSKIWFIERKRELIMTEFEKPISYMVDCVKIIKKAFNWAIDKDQIYFN